MVEFSPYFRTEAALAEIRQACAEIVASVASMGAANAESVKSMQVILERAIAHAEATTQAA